MTNKETIGEVIGLAKGLQPFLERWCVWTKDPMKENSALAMAQLEADSADLSYVPDDFIEKANREVFNIGLENSANASPRQRFLIEIMGLTEKKE